MSEDKKGPRKTRGSPIELGVWWHDEMLQAFGNRSDAVVAEMLTQAAAKPGELWWSRDEIGKLRRKEAPPTLQLVKAISTAFGVTNPVLVARSRPEAMLMYGVQREQDLLRSKTITQTEIERADVNASMAKLLETSLGEEGIAETNAAAERAQNAQKRRKLRDERDGQKKHRRDVKL